MSSNGLFTIHPFRNPFASCGILFPVGSGENHDKRQDLLQREGLNKPKKSTLLGVGGADLASAGANDMFSKAIYDPAKACAVEGLVETCIPGRFTPRKVAAVPPTAETTNTAAAAPPVTTDVAHRNDGRKPSSGREDSSSDGAGCLRASSSSAAVGTVFRVVPNGLGNHDILAGRGGAAVAGIAPSKRLCGSRSTPIFPSQGSKPSTRERAGTPPSSVADVSPRTTMRSGLGFAERLHAATGRAGDCDGGGSGKNKRGFTRSKSELEVGTTAGKGANARSSSAGSPQNVGSTRIGYPGPRGASPAQRRISEQLALDLAAVRSL